MTNTRKGWFGELTCEYAPRAQNPLGGSDFMRDDLMITNYLPIVAETSFSRYLAQRIATDYFRGKEIPDIVSASFGGRVIGLGIDGIPGPGGVVRGVDPNKYDGYFKFFDIGYYDDLGKSLDAERLIPGGRRRFDTSP